MFELKITNLHEALRLSQHWATHTVSLIDPDYPLEIPQPSRNSLVLCEFFHDISDQYLGFQLATAEQLADILAFTAPLQSSDRLLIHCHAGISRSTAVACGVLCQHGVTPDLAVQYVLSIRPQAYPNSYIITLFDEMLGLEGKLIEARDQLDTFYFEQLFNEWE